LPSRKRKRSEPDPALAGFIINALTAGPGRNIVVGSRDELIQRLREDGVEFKVSDVLTVLSTMIGDGRVAHRPGVGLWLQGDAPVTLWEPDITRVADIEAFFGGGGRSRGWL
jgi:hypothetical protein